MTQAQMIAQAVAVALAQVIGQMPASAKIGRKTKAAAAKVRRTPEALQASLEAASKKQGNKGPVVQHETVKTYAGWLEVGRRVIPKAEGGKGGLPGFKNLFHLEQTREEASAS